MLKTIKLMWLDLLTTTLCGAVFVVMAYESIFKLDQDAEPSRELACMLLTCMLGIRLGQWLCADIVKYRRLRKEGK